MSAEVVRAARSFPVVVVTGPRRCGKTCLLRGTFPAAHWVLLEDPDILARVRSDARGFLDSLRPPVILDEIQNAPELLPYIRTRVDLAPEQRGVWFLTGSQEWSLMRGVTESMAGRAAILRLLPFGLEETPRVTLYRGGFPEVALEPERSGLWFESYIQTWIERDVRAVTNVSNIALFRRFLSVLATRTGQVLNRTDIAAPLGVSVPTLSSWIDLLETTGTILVVPPWHSNLGRRMLKSPRIYFCDPGLTCHLLGFHDEDALERSPCLGPVWEGQVAAELVKHRIFRGRRPGLHWFRDQQGLEVDFILEGEGLEPVLVEAKATHTPTPADAKAIRRLRAAVPDAHAEDYVVHRQSSGAPDISALAPGVLAVGLETLHQRLAARKL
jgi:predicted AAA+ superfamily ATPase